MAKQKYSGKSAETRTEHEAGEGLDLKQVDAPAARFQEQQQVNTAMKQGDNSTPDSSYIRRKTEAKGAKLRQAVAAEVITKSSGATGAASDVIAPSAVNLRSMSFGGDAGTILGDASGTPVLAKDIQGQSRFDKRNSDANKQLNYIASEQVVTAYDNIPALAEDPSAEVGYNGNPKLQAPRSTKTAGVSPADLLYERSLDELRRDAFVFTQGQVVKQEGVVYADYPTRTTAYSADSGVWERGASFDLKRGNYSPRQIEAVFKNDGAGAYLASFEVKVDDYSINDAPYDVVNRSATNQVVDINRAELARQRIDADAGAPTMPGFCPLGRSVEQPSQTVLLLHDMEATLGATVATAYRFAQKARGYYLNRAAKDGQDPVGPARDALYGHLIGAVNMDQLNAVVKSTDDRPFDDPLGCQAGSAFTLVKAFDSVTKYKTKADLINQPRSLKLHLQTADNNMNPMRVPSQFIKALNAADVFSTIDRGYDPLSTVEITDNVRLVYPYDWSKMLKFTRAKYGAPRDYSNGSKLFAYDYTAGSGSNRYVIKCGEPLLNGIAYMLEVMANSFFTALKSGKDTTEVTLVIPTVHSTCHFSLWDYLVCAATPYMLYERTNTMKDILDFEFNHSYPFTDLVTLGETNMMAPTNYSMPGSDRPLVVGQMTPGSAITWTWPELFQRLDDNVLCPWYFSENSFAITGSGAAMTLQDNGSREFLTPVLRSGQRLDVVDDAQGMEPMDLALAMDIMTTTPSGLNSFKGGVYKYSRAAEGIPYYSPDGFRELKATYKMMHSIPRITGWIMPAFPGECCVYSDTAPKLYGALVDSTTTFAPTESSSIRARAYYAANVNKDTAILAVASMALNRAQAFTQRWSEYRATTEFGNYASDDFDLGLSLTDYVSGDPTALAATANQTSFAPFTGVGTPLFALHKYLWVRIGKLPFAINPFDASKWAAIDPFDVAYAFNLAGFMSADYNEKEYNRRNQRQNQGYGFTEDPYVEESPIFR